MSIFSFLTQHGQANASHTTDSMETIQANVQSGKAVLIDVREMDEWKAGHVKGAILAPLSLLRALPADTQPKGVPSGKILYVHCRSGGRAIPATSILMKAKNDARALKWGFSALAQAGFPTE